MGSVISQLNIKPTTELPVKEQNNYIPLMFDKTITTTFDPDKTNIPAKTELEPFAQKTKKLEIPVAKPMNRPDNAPAFDNPEKKDLHFIFFADAHSRFERMSQFVNEANEINADLVIDGGDIVHDATEPELDRAYNDRKKIKAPVYLTTGNHDVDFRGPFHNKPPELPPFQSFDAKGVHFILMDDESQAITEEQFKKLETDLENNKGKPTVVSMHVPVYLSKEPLTVKLTKKLPLNFKSPTLLEKDQIERFSSLMSKYKVKAVLTGHTHFPDQIEKGGVKYVTVSSTGGLTPGMGINNEFLDIHFDGKELDIKTITLHENSKNPIGFMVNTMDFYQDLNSFNHNSIGWNYIPSASIQYSAGGKITESKNGKSFATEIDATMERNVSPKSSVFATGGLTVGPKDLNIGLDLGYKYRVVGDYNKNIYVAGTVGANGGMVVGKASAGVGVGVSAGAEYKNFTFGMGYEMNTNSKAVTATVGYRF